MRDDPTSVEAHEHQAWQGAAPIYVDYVALLTAVRVGNGHHRFHPR